MLLLDLTAAEKMQPDLFADGGEKDGGENRKDRGMRIMAAIDAVNRRLGPGAVHYANTGIHKSWQMRQTHRSPRYTTDWNELPLV